MAKIKGFNFVLLDYFDPIMWLLVPICGVKKFKLYLKDMFKISEKCK